MTVTWKQLARRTACAVVLGAGTLGAMAAQPATATPEAAQATGTVDAKADEVMARSIEIMWGEIAESRDIQTVVISGTMSLPTMGIEGTMKIWIDIENDVSKSVITIPGLDTQTRGIYEETAWSDSLMSGPRIIEGEEAAQMLRDSDFFSSLKYKETYSTREHLGTEEVNGEACDKIRLVRADDGSEQLNWYSPKGLLVKQQQTVVNEMGKMPITSLSEDYRQVGAAMMSFRTVVEAMGTKQVMQFDEITVNEPIEDEDLKPTPGVAKLMG